MNSRRSRLQRWLLMCLISLSGRGAFAQSSVPTIVALTPAIEFGSIPSDLPQFATAKLSLVVRSNSPWTVSVVLDTSKPFALVDAVPIGAGDILSVRSGDRWISLTPGMPVPISAGSGKAAGEVVEFDLRMSVAFDSACALHEGHIRFVSNGRPLETQVALFYIVPPVTRLLNDPQPYESPVVDPTRPAIYEFAPQTYLILSNVPWVLEVSVLRPPTIVGSSITLPHDALVLLNGDEIRPLEAVGKPMIVSKGGPTGRDGKPIQLRLGLRIRGAEVGGSYSTEIDVQPRADATVSK